MTANIIGATAFMGVAAVVISLAAYSDEIRARWRVNRRRRKMHAVPPVKQSNVRVLP